MGAVSVGSAVKKISHVDVDRFQSRPTLIPANKFIDNLGPMFSYLTASSYLYKNRNNSSIENTMEFHIDAFRSKNTIAWINLTKKLSPKIF